MLQYADWVNLMLGLDINEQRQTTLRWRDLTNLLMRMQYNIVRTPVIAHARILSDPLFV